MPILSSDYQNRLITYQSCLKMLPNLSVLLQHGLFLRIFASNNNAKKQFGMTTLIILLAFAVVILVVMVALLFLRTQQQSDELKEKNKIIVREVQRRSVLEGRMLA